MSKPIVLANSDDLLEGVVKASGMDITEQEVSLINKLEVVLESGKPAAFTVSFNIPADLIEEN